MMLTNWEKWVLVIAGLLVLAGCETLPKKVAIIPPPPPQNYFSPTEGRAMRRVALLPLYSEKFSGEYLRDLDVAFTGELTKTSSFEVVSISRSSLDALFGTPQFSSVEMLPAHFLEKLRTHFSVDGILLTDITAYSPYRPLGIGVRAKLLDASSGTIRWAFDYLFDSGNPAIADSAKLFQRQESDDHLPLPTDGGTVLLSPSRYAKFVASQTYASLRNSGPTVQ